ncbi:MAG: BrnT family toxin [gamma proteobacterium symbiont of Bathyaustriella thionipta]|nr:BrnT family toxin [gamma proteobacterium symbiont of Bathyaustriella thionipta]
MQIFNWNSEKNQTPIESRGISFEEAIFYIKSGGLLDDITHTNNLEYPDQRIFIVNIDEYAFLIPYVENEEEIFLKTIIPSRKFTRLYLGGKS